jgi:hypothetical protein
MTMTAVTCFTSTRFHACNTLRIGRTRGAHNPQSPCSTMSARHSTGGVRRKLNKAALTARNSPRTSSGIFPVLCSRNSLLSRTESVANLGDSSPYATPAADFFALLPCRYLEKAPLSLAANALYMAITHATISLQPSNSRF